MSYTAWSVIAGETPLASKWNLLGSNDADFDSRLTQDQADKTIGNASDAATVTFDMSVRRMWEVTIAGNRTLAFSNVLTKRAFGIFIKQDGTGGRTVTWPAAVVWPGNTPPTLSTAPNAVDGFIITPKNAFVPTSNEVYRGGFIGFNWPS